MVRRGGIAEIAAFFLLSAGAFAQDWVLPDPPAIELPAAAMSQIADSEEPMASLLASVSYGSYAVTHDRVGYNFPVGYTEVTWTAWEGPTPLSTIASNVFVFRYGETPVGVTKDDRATAGNHSAKVVRTADGAIHVCWLDSDRPDAPGTGHQVMYRRAAQDQDTGEITWAGPAERISSGLGENNRSHCGAAAGDNSVHFTWFEGTNRYRRLVFSGSWNWESTVDLGTTGSMPDNGPDICATGDDEVYIATVGGDMTYFWSTNGGTSFSSSAIPYPPSGGAKGPSLGVDSQDNAHVSYTRTVRGSKFGSWHEDEPNGGYWEIWYLMRTPGAGGSWSAGENVLADFVDWQDAHTRFDPGDPEYDWDVLADWIDIDVDASDNIHIAWHGSINTHIFGNDESFYVRKPATGPGTWVADWEQWVELHPQNPPLNHYFSWCPTLCTDALSDLAVCILFYNTQAVDGTDALYQSAFRAVRGGVLEGASVDLSLAASADMSTWFSSTGHNVYKHPNGRAWLDVLQTEVPLSKQSPYIVTLQRHEVTDLLYPDKVTGPDPVDEAIDVAVDKTLGWDPANRADGYNVYFGTDETAVGDATTSSGEFQGNQPGLTFDPGTLSYSQTYYWRIDGVNSNGTTKGDVWEFTVEPDVEPPLLDVTAVVLKGTAVDVGSGVSSVLVNGQSRPVVADEWTSQDVLLPSGSPVNVQATDASSNTTTVQVAVTF